MSARKLLLPIGVIIALGVYLLRSSPDGVVVTPSGSVTGFVNRSRAFLQGDEFWRHQLGEARRELQHKIDHQANDQAKIVADFAELKKLELQAALAAEAFLQKQTNLSAPQRQALALRSAADRLEEAEKLRVAEHYFEKQSRERIDELQRIISMIQGRDK